VAKTLLFPSIFITCALLLPLHACAEVSKIAHNAAEYAEKTYAKDMISSLRALLKFNTVAKEGVPSTENPEHQKFKNELARQAAHLGFDFTDYGYVIVIGHGESEQRLGMITHGDIQPFTPSKWTQHPLTLDLNSEPGKLIGRGTEDDKGAITNALYAMKSIKDLNIALNKRIELYVYMAEESDWEPLRQHIKQHALPQVNITLDAEYPVVTAEKGYGTISMTFPNNKYKSENAYIVEFSGGFFGSQIPENAQTTIANADQALLHTLKEKATSHTGMHYEFHWHKSSLTIKAQGKSAHSSKPEHGVNAITHLADLLSFTHWPNNTGGSLVNFINDNLGTGLYGEKFGDIAYSDSFMGPMSVQPTVLKQTPEGIELNINIRRPRGKLASQLEAEIKVVLAKWQQKYQVKLLNTNNVITDPFVQNNAPHIDTLLKVFSKYTGIKNPQPISIGGGTNSRLFPNAVSFGPSMPSTEYTGHSEHEFITLKQFVLNLKMYTAVLIELAK